MKKIDNIDLLSTRSGLQKKLNENFEEINRALPLEGEVGAVLTKGVSKNEWKRLPEIATITDLEVTTKHLIKHLAPNGKIVLKNGGTLRGMTFKTVPTDVYDFSQMTDIVYLFSGMPYIESINDFDFSKVTIGERIIKDSPRITEFVNHTTGNFKSFYYTFAYSSIKHADFNTSGATQMAQTFSVCVSLESIALLDATKWASANSLIVGCTKLTDIAGFKNLSCDISAWNCHAITPESIKNIATHAKDMTGLEPITFTFMKDVIVRTPEATLQIFTNKNIIIKTF